MQRLLIVGCGDIALRAAPLLRTRFKLSALSHTAQRFDALRLAGIEPIPGDLDDAASLSRIAGLARVVLHFAPPQNHGTRDARTRNLLAAISRSVILPYRFVYISTSGVYGDCKGEPVAETRPVNPATPRAFRRLDAENRIREWGVRNRVAVTLLRVPGIYSADRLPRSRLEAKIPALDRESDGYTNHIHADDLARAAMLALYRGKPGRAYHVSDDSGLKMGDYLDLVARHLGLQLPPRVSASEARAAIPESILSFMRESRRLDNSRIKRELRFALRYPEVSSGIAHSSLAREKGLE